MKLVTIVLWAGSFAALGAQTRTQEQPFVGRWNFTIAPFQANWLSVSARGSELEILFQPTTDHVIQVRDFKLAGTHLTLNLLPATKRAAALIWELDAAGDKLTGAQHRGDQQASLLGVRAPALNRAEPAGWTDPEPLFNGTDLTGWEPLDKAPSRWVASNGELVNEAHGANLRTTRTFEDFKLHMEFNCPAGGNSGIYLRGRYEVQVEYEPPDKNPPERAIGSIYGRIAPAVVLPKTPGTWESYDITLVGRTVTIRRNGVLTIDHKEIEGITGGAIDANEDSPGPIYLQGDHTGGLRFRNIRIAFPER
jgi:hypothetical protein